jgi:iduronate 2-sulfatase
MKKRLTFGLLKLLSLVLLLADMGIVWAAQPNVLLICVDDLRPELACFGKDYIHSPHIDALAARGRAFHRHYVQAPTCGASRYTLLTGQYGSSSNDAIFKRAERLKKQPDSVPPSMPAWFKQHGYTTVSVGKVSHHPGGRGGPDWNDDDQPEMPDSWDRHLLPAGAWQHPRGAMHGLANGEIRMDRGQMDIYQSVAGDDSIYPDGLIVDEALEQLNQLTAADKPFLLAVGIIRPHLPFGAPAKYMQHYAGVELPSIPHPKKPSGKTTWHGSNEFMTYNRWNRNPNEDAEFASEVRRHYAACVSFADAQVGRVLGRLEELGARDNTIIVLWGDHGWHLGEHAIWGKHALFEESLRSPLIVQYQHLPVPGQATDSVVETLDVFPTLCDVAGVPMPDFVQGESLRPSLEDPQAVGHAAVSYMKAARTLRTQTHRLIVHDDGHVELYDHRTPEQESRNVAAAHSDLVASLTAQLAERLSNSE